jgi:hypothetical protein
VNNLDFLYTVGLHTTEDGFMWDNLFTFQTLVFIGILILLIWGLYSYFTTKSNEEKADQNFNQELNRMNREEVQAYLREKEAEKNFDSDMQDDYINIRKDQNKY